MSLGQIFYASASYQIIQNCIPILTFDHCHEILGQMLTDTDRTDTDAHNNNTPLTLGMRGKDTDKTVNLFQSQQPND